ARLAGQAHVARLSPQLVLTMSRALLANGADPIPLLRKALSHHPDDFWLNTGLALPLYLAKQWDEAIGYYRAALALRPATGVHNNLALALYHKGQIDEAANHFQKAVRLDAKDAIAITNLGMARYAQGRLDEAISHYEDALRLDPTYAIAHYNFGLVL